MSEFYIIKPAVNTKETGSAYPQVGLSLNYDKNNQNSIRNLKSFELPNFQPNFNYFELNTKANLTDLLSASMMQYGLMISENLKSLITEFNLQEYQTFEVPVYSTKNTHQYYWLHFGKTDVLSNINFLKSNFAIYEFGFKKDNITIESYEHYQSTLSSISSMSNIKAELISINSAPNYDLFVIPFIDGLIYVSNNLKSAIEQSKLTGVDIKLATHLTLLNTT
jgi:hypothetical protein